MCVADEELTSGLGVVLVCLFTIVCVCVSVQALVGSSACEPALVRPSSVDQPFFGTGYILVGVCLEAVVGGPRGCPLPCWAGSCPLIASWMTAGYSLLGI